LLAGNFEFLRFEGQKNHRQNKKGSKKDEKRSRQRASREESGKIENLS